MEEAEQADLAVGAMQAKPRGTLRVGAPVAFAIKIKLPHLGQRYPPRGSFDQANPQPGLQTVDGTADTRFGYAKPFRCLGEALRLRDLDEELKLIQIRHDCSHVETVCCRSV